jgi:hypothetical protein
MGSVDCALQPTARMTGERRTSNRVSTSLVGQWKRGKKLVSGRVADLNGGGIFLETTEQIAPGQVMDIIIDTPSGPLEFLGVSRRCTQAARHGIGISIFSIDTKDKARWLKLYSVLMAQTRP